MSKTQYILKNINFGGYACRFSRKGQGCIQLTPDRIRAKAFTSILAAQKWIEKYVDAGFGLTAGDFVVEQL